MTISSSSVLLKTSKVVTLPGVSRLSSFSQTQCLQWRRQTLWVKKATVPQVPVLPALSHETWLRDCLERSTVKRICLDPKLGEEAVFTWANIARQVDKDVFVRIRACSRLSKERQSFGWRLQHLLSRVVGFGLLVFLSPLMVLVMVLLKFSAGDSVFETQWCVGQRGRLFRKVQFCTVVVEVQKCQVTGLGYWLRQLHLDRLPQLLNVVRGEITLFGSCSWTLSEAMGLDDSAQGQLSPSLA